MSYLLTRSTVVVCPLSGLGRKLCDPAQKLIHPHPFSIGPVALPVCPRSLVIRSGALRMERSLAAFDGLAKALNMRLQSGNRPLVQHLFIARWLVGLVVLRLAGCRAGGNVFPIDPDPNFAVVSWLFAQAKPHGLLARRFRRYAKTLA